MGKKTTRMVLCLINFFEEVKVELKAGCKKVITMVKPGKNISGTERGKCKCAEAGQF